MARVTREQAAAHRQSLVDAAGRLFREKGLDGVGVAEISKAAGLTHGALYSAFASKQELAVYAFAAGAAASRARRAQALGASPDPGAIIDRYLSRQQRDDWVNCCPLLASASEGARQADAYREAFTDVFSEAAQSLQTAMQRHGDADPDRACVVAAAMIGVMAVARALKGDASDKLLAAARRYLADLAVPDGAG